LPTGSSAAPPGAEATLTCSAGFRISHDLNELFKDATFAMESRHIKPIHSKPGQFIICARSHFVHFLG
jgi:hypothetical protein